MRKHLAIGFSATLLLGCSERFSADDEAGPDLDCSETDDWDAAYAEREQEVLDLVNARREAGADCGGVAIAAAPPLAMDPALQCAARLHSKDMVEQDYFSHFDPEGVGPSQRMQAVGFEGSSWGENIATGYAEAESIVALWMESEEHCANIMSANYALIGVGYYSDGEFRHFWTQTLGSVE